MPEPAGVTADLALARELARSTLLPSIYRGNVANVLVAVIAARELQVPLLTFIRGASIEAETGRFVMGSDFIVALCMRRSELCEWFRCVETSDDVAVYETKRQGQEPQTHRFTRDEAARAGLLNKRQWKDYPAAMLRARCASALARMVYPDLALGIYTPEETADLPATTEPQHWAESPRTGAPAVEVSWSEHRGVGFVPDHTLAGGAVAADGDGVMYATVALFGRHAGKLLSALTQEELEPLAYRLSRWSEADRHGLVAVFGIDPQVADQAALLFEAGVKREMARRGVAQEAGDAQQEG